MKEMKHIRGVMAILAMVYLLVYAVNGHNLRDIPEHLNQQDKVEQVND